jgi:excinuclease ABC subunit C
VKGLGPKRSEAIVDRFETLWSLRHASVDEVAEVPTITRSLAEKVIQAIQ